MPPARNQRRGGTLSTYAPLLITLTVATVGALAWILSDRGSPDDDDGDDQSPSSGIGPSSTATGPPPYRQDESVYDRAGTTGNTVLASARSWAGAAGAALGLKGPDGRSPEEQGRDATGRAHGPWTTGKSRAGDRAGPVREDGFSDHERWTEQAVLLKEKDRKTPAGPTATAAGGPDAGRTSGKSVMTREGKAKGRSVAVVLAAEERHLQHGQSGNEHTSLLSHISSSALGAITVYVLIYLPPSTSSLPEVSPLSVQARALVGDATQILPFSTPTGYVHMVRHLGPNLVYVQDGPDISGPGGANLVQLKGWVGQTVLVVGEDGTGGLADTETEGEGEGGDRGRARWYETSDMVGLGKGLEVVDVMRLEDDWLRRTR